MSVAADVVRRHYDCFNRAAWDEWRELLTGDFAVHHASAGETRGRDAYIDGVRGYRLSFPDVTVVLHRVIAQDNLVAAEFTSNGTFADVFAGIQPTGKTWELAGMGFYRVDGDKLAEAWFVEDLTGWLHSLGA